MKKCIAALALSVCLSAPAWAATPTFAQVETALQSHEYAQARVQMDEILRKRPESVRAHNLNAQLIIAEGGDDQKAAVELAQANKLKVKGDVLVPADDHFKGLRYILFAISAIAVGIACFLGKEYVTIRSRSKAKVVEDVVEPIEKDATNYSTPMTIHGV